MTQTTIDAMLGLLANVPQGDGEWEKKSRIICDAAQQLSNKVLASVGFTEPGSDAWLANSLVEVPSDQGKIDNPPPDFVREMYLNSVSPSLAETNPDKTSTDWHLVFGRGRVFEWNQHENIEDMVVLTYEGAMRLFVFWFARKLLDITQENNWDRVALLPNLLDRFLDLIATKLPRDMTGAELKEQLGLPFNPEVLLLEVSSERFEISSETCETLETMGLPFIWNVATTTWQTLLNKGLKLRKRREVTDALRELNLEIDMELPRKVIDWIKTNR